MVIPIGSGPYTIADINPGKSISYKRNPTIIYQNSGFSNFALSKSNSIGTLQFIKGFFLLKERHFLCFLQAFLRTGFINFIQVFINRFD